MKVAPKLTCGPERSVPSARSVQSAFVLLPFVYATMMRVSAHVMRLSAPHGSARARPNRVLDHLRRVEHARDAGARVSTGTDEVETIEIRRLVVVAEPG